MPKTARPPKVWLAKVLADWYPDLINTSTVAIDEGGIDGKFPEVITPAMFDKQMRAVAARPGSRRRPFVNFTDARPGDLVIIAKGQAAQFTIYAVATLKGTYKFDDKMPIRHYIDADIKELPTPIHFHTWAWAKRFDELPTTKMGELGQVLWAIAQQLP